MKEKTKIVLYNLKKTSSLPLELDKHLHPQEQSIKRIDTPIDLALYLQKHRNIFLIFSIDNDIELSEVKVILNKLKSRIIVKEICLTALVTTKKRSTTNLLKELNCHYIFEHDYVTTKEILKRIESFHLSKDQEDQIESSYLTYERSKKGFKQINLESGQLTVSLEDSEGQKHEVQMEHFEPGNLELILSEDIKLELNQQSQIIVLFEYSRCRVEISLQGRVSAIEKEHSRQYVLIETLEDKEIDLEMFFKTYQMRQKSINDFLLLAKGA